MPYLVMRSTDEQESEYARDLREARERLAASLPDTVVIKTPLYAVGVELDDFTLATAEAAGKAAYESDAEVQS
jgi:hypothetical protein